MGALSDVLKQRRKELGLTLAQIAEMMGVAEATVQRWESGNIKSIRHEKIGKLAEILRVSPSALMGWSQDESPATLSVSNLSPMPQTYKVPLLGKIACGQPILAVEEAEETADVPAWVKADFALQCQGDSMMGARILDGDVVYIRAQDTVENGQIAAVLIKDNGTWEENATLKRYYQHPGLISLRAANPSYPDMDYVGEDMSRVRVLGLVVGFTSTTIK